MTSTINIAKVLNKDHAISQEDARKITPFLEAAVANQKRLRLSFGGIDNCSSIFLRHTLGNLYLRYGTAVEAYIQIVDINPDDEVLPYQLTRLKERALNSGTYKPIFDQAVGLA